MQLLQSRLKNRRILIGVLVIKISDIALDVLLEGLKASQVEKQLGLRLIEEGDMFTLKLDTATSTDRVISHNGHQVLIIDPVFEARFGNASIDIECTPEGSEIIIRNNNP